MGRRVLQGARLLLMFAGGSAILYHEVWVTDSSEPILVIVGLWLTGAPIAEFLDKLRRIAALPASVSSASAVEDASKSLSPGTPTPESWDRRRKRK